MSNEPNDNGPATPVAQALRVYAEASKDKRCPICNGIESCDHTVRERLLVDLHADETIASSASSMSSPQKNFARWLEDGPRLAKAAGCYVGIKVTAA